MFRSEDVFDTVLMATGRYALTKALNLPAAGVTVSATYPIYLPTYSQESRN